MSNYSDAISLGVRFRLSIAVAGAMLAIGGCSKPPAKPLPVSRPSLPDYLPMAAPEILAKEAASTMTQLGARMILNGEGTVRSVVFTDIPISDAALVRLQDLPDLEVLSLSGTQVTNSGMSHLTNLERLSYLFMNDTDITDQGLMTLADSVALRYISLDNTDVTAQAVEEFRKRSPGTVVQHSPRKVETDEFSTPEYQLPGRKSDQELDGNRIAGGNRSKSSEARKIGADFGDVEEKADVETPATSVRLRYRNENPPQQPARGK